MAITRVNHPSHPEHELELKLKHHKKQYYTCDGCKKEGSGLRYRCDKCDFDLHQYCMFNAQITNSKDSLLKTTIRSDTCDFDLHEDCMLNPQITNSKNSLLKSTIKSDMAAEDHPNHPQHELKLKHYKKPYNCNGCKEQGFGSRYRCEDCDYDLHKDCMFNAQTTSHEFFHGSTLRFFKKPPINSEKYNTYCNACGKLVNGFVYHCADKDLDFHPCCRNLKNKILIDGVSFRLKDKKVSSKCIKCNHKTLEGSSSGIRGWSYVSSCKEYNFHVYCVTQIVVEGWKNSDNDDDVSMALENMKLPLQRRSNSSGGLGRKYWKILQIFLKTVAAILLGDPTVVLTSAAINLITNL